MHPSKSFLSYARRNEILVELIISDSCASHSWTLTAKENVKGESFKLNECEIKVLQNNIFSSRGPRSKTTSAESTHPYGREGERRPLPPNIKTLNTTSSGGGGGRLEGGGLRLAECDGVGEVLLLLQPQPPHAVVLGPPRRLGCHLQVDLEIYRV